MRSLLLLASLSLLACGNRVLGSSGPPGTQDPVCTFGSACSADDVPCSSIEPLACGDVALDAVCDGGVWLRPFAGCANVGACSAVGHWLVTVDPAAAVEPFEVVVTSPAPGALAVTSSPFGPGSKLSFTAETCTLRLESAGSTSCDTFGGEEFCSTWVDVLELGTGPAPWATFEETCWGECGNGSVFDATVTPL